MIIMTSLLRSPRTAQTSGTIYNCTLYHHLPICANGPDAQSGNEIALPAAESKATGQRPPTKLPEGAIGSSL